MNATILNSVTDGLRGTFDSIFGFVPIKNEIKLTSQLEPQYDCLLQMDFSGDINGFFLLSFDFSVAKKIVSFMMGSEAPDEFTENETSCLEELGNMMKSSMLIELSKQNKKCNISSISFISKEKMTAHEQPVLVVGTESEFGFIEFHYSIN